MDSIKSVIQDTMKYVHENIDKVQSNVDKVQTDVRSLEQGWRKEFNSALDKVKLKTANGSKFSLTYYNLIVFLL
jgi:phage-related protein